MRAAGVLGLVLGLAAASAALAALWGHSGAYAAGGYYVYGWRWPVGRVVDLEAVTVSGAPLRWVDLWDGGGLVGFDSYSGRACYRLTIEAPGFVWHTERASGCAPLQASWSATGGPLRVDWAYPERACLMLAESLSGPRTLLQCDPAPAVLALAGVDSAYVPAPGRWLLAVPAERIFDPPLEALPIPWHRVALPAVSGP